MAEPGRALKRLREIASKPKIAARERVVAVGVEGNEVLPVRNLNKPNKWTILSLSFGSNFRK